MDGNRPEVFSPNTIRMTDSLDKLLRDDDDDDPLDADAATSSHNLAGDANTATPKPLKFDGHRGVGAFEPPKQSAMNRLRGPGVDVAATTAEGSLHTPKPQRVSGARYGREGGDGHLHHHQHLHSQLSYDHYQGRPSHHDHFFTPLVEDPNMGYHDMHSFGPIPPTVISPLTIPEYPPSHYPMQAASWSPIPPEFGNHNMLGGRDAHWAHQPHHPPTEFHPHAAAAAGFDHHHYQQMPIPHPNQHSHYHLPGNVSPFMPHYTPHMGHQAPSYTQTTAPLSPRNSTDYEQHQHYGGPGEMSPQGHGRPRNDSCASVNSVSSKSAGGGTVSPVYSRLNLQVNSSEEESNWFVPHARSTETHSRGGSHAYPHPIYGGSSGPTGAARQVTAGEKKQVKKVSLKPTKDSGQTPHQSKSFQAKGGVRSASAAVNSANQEFLESPAERAAFKVC
jgi:hypothetical protein